MSNKEEHKGTFQEMSNKATALVFSSLVFAIGVLSIVVIASFLKEDVREATFAVLDIEEAIGKTVKQRLEAVTDKDEVKLIVTDGRKQVENWLSERLEFHCGAPCVVFKRGDVVYGDVVDLNAQYERETIEALLNQGSRFNAINGK